MLSTSSDSLCGSSRDNPFVIEEDSPAQFTVRPFLSPEGSCESPVKPVLHRRESFRLSTFVAWWYKYMCILRLYRRLIEELSASGDSACESDDEQFNKRKPPLKYAALFYPLCDGMVTYRRVIESDDICDSDDEVVHKGKLCKYVCICCLHGGMMTSMLCRGVIEEPTTSDGVYYENKFVYVKSVHLIIFVSYCTYTYYRANDNYPVYETPPDKYPAERIIKILLDPSIKKTKICHQQPTKITKSSTPTYWNWQERKSCISQA